MQQKSRPWPEITIEYSPAQRTLYDNNDPSCIYPIWPCRIGIHKKGGNFPVMVVSKYYEDKGYTALARYLLVRCPNQREYNDGFRTICKIFGKEKMLQVLQASRHLKGGDPDLFVYNKDFSECFFVEVKEKDNLILNQLALIPIIKKYLCPVYIVRVKSKASNSVVTASVAAQGFK
jgi:hypothetical protein